MPIKIIASVFFLMATALALGTPHLSLANTQSYHLARQALTQAAGHNNPAHYQQVLEEFLFAEMVTDKEKLSLRQILQRYYDPHQTQTPTDKSLPPWGPLIFVGNTHTDLGQQIINSEVIKRLAHEGDHVLLESVAPGELIDQSQAEETAAIPTPLNISGWDDIEALKLNLSCIQRTLALLQTLERKNQQIQQSLQHSGEECDRLLNETDALLEEGQRINKIIMRLVARRNASLRKSVTTRLQQLQKGQRLFVIAGSAHLTPELLRPLTKTPTILIPLPTAAPEQKSAQEYYDVETMDYESFICSEN